ncbi:MAG: proline--tRNA ligase [Thermoplasmata archaeon]
MRPEEEEPAPPRAPKADGEEAPLRHRKAEDFSEWYNEVVERAGLCDKRYPVKGLNVWTPYGWRAMGLIDSAIRAMMEETGHQEVCFPLLIPEDQFRKEAEHIRGFEDEVYWVTRAGGSELDVKLLLRPTSETAMYPVLSLWIRSHADLPLKIFQIVNAFRFDTKQTRAFIRMREFHFFEAHTCHRDYEDAESQIAQDLEIMKKLAELLCLDYMVFRRPEWDKFPGAHYSLACDTLMPDGRTLQIGTIHQYRDNFARAYGITYEDEAGNHPHVHQTTYGMSERLLGAVVGVHGDDGGLVLPPAIAPVQVVVVPVLAKEMKEPVIQAARELAAELRSCGLRAHLDDRDIRPGAKYYYWEMRGVPLRIELGPRDIEKRQVILVRRDTREKLAVSRDGVGDEARALLDRIALNLLERSRELMRRGIRDITDLVEEAPTGILRAGWCGSEACGREIEDRLGVRMLGTLFGGESYSGKCVACGREAAAAAYLARTY